MPINYGSLLVFFSHEKLTTGTACKLCRVTAEGMGMKKEEEKGTSPIE